MAMMAIREVKLYRLHPENSDDDDSESTDPVDFIFNQDMTFVPKIITDRRLELVTDNNPEIFGPNFQEVLRVLRRFRPGFDLNLSRKTAVKFSTDLFEGIDLEINYSRMLGMRGKEEFDETLGYLEIERDRFRDLVINQDGYLNKLHNYVYIDEELTSVGTSAIILNNARVILFWRNLRLDEHTRQRIVTLGFTYLSKIITEGELVYKIKQLIPNGVYQVSIRSEPMNYVLIGVEAPVFRF